MEGSTSRLQNNFWEDDVFDDIKITASTVNDENRAMLNDTHPETCLKKCQDRKCVSFFYHGKDKRCELLDFNPVVSKPSDRRHIAPYHGNRLYRYQPQSDTSNFQMY